MAFSTYSVLAVLLAAVVTAYAVFELVRPDILLVGNVTVDVLRAGSIGAPQTSTRPGGVALTPLFSSRVCVQSK